MNAETILMTVVLVALFLLIARKGGCCGMNMKGKGKDEDKPKKQGGAL